MSGQPEETLRGGVSVLETGYFTPTCEPSMLQVRLILLSLNVFKQGKAISHFLSEERDR